MSSVSKNWKFIEDFVTNSNRLREIFFDLPNSTSNLKFEELIELGKSDELFSFLLHLLIEETKLRRSIDICADFSNFCTIESWFDQVLAGLIFEPFPTVELLLKRQNRPSVYREFDEMFAATKLLNSLQSIYNPNSDFIDASNVLSTNQFEIYGNIPKDLKLLIDSVFIINVPVSLEAPFANGPSFKFELLNYIDFESKSEFKSIPVELLEMTEGSDIGSPFGKRWSRRLSAKSSAYDKIHFDLLKIGQFPKPIPIPKSLSFEPSNLNFQVQLPENVGIELLHQNVFDSSFLSSDFLDYSAFSVHFSKYLEQVPSILTHKLTNTDIFEHAPNIKTSSKCGTLSSFRALLLVSGLRGHLNSESLPLVDIHEILNFDSEGTSACLLLSLALSSLKSELKNDQSKFLNKLFTMHLPSFQSSLELEIPPILQLSASLSLGLFKFRSFDRGTCQLLLKEIFRPLPLNINIKPTEDTPLFSIIPAFTLGMCLMGSSDSSSNNSEFANDIQLQLNSNLLSNGSRTQHGISVLISSAFINIGNDQFDNFIWSRSLPDLLDKPEGIVFWNLLTWRLSQWHKIAVNVATDAENRDEKTKRNMDKFDKKENNNADFCLDEQGFDKVKINFIKIFDSVCNPSEDSIWTDSSELGLFVYSCQVLIANSVFLALKLSGTEKSNESLDFWLKKLHSYKIIYNTDEDFFLTKIQSHLITTFQYLLLCKCLIFAGSGDSACWSILRSFMADPLLFKYGNGKLFYSSIGFLFLGKGRLTIKTEDLSKRKINYLAIASLLCSICPILPSSPVDSELSFVTLMNSLWPLAVSSRY